MTNLSVEAIKAKQAAAHRQIIKGFVVAPKPITKNLLDLAAETIASKQQWAIGEDVIIWQSGNTQAYIVNECSRLTLHILREGKNLSDNVISEGLKIGHNNGGKWEMLNRQALEYYTNYPMWIKSVKREIK